MFVRWKRKRRKDTYHLEPVDPGIHVSYRRQIPDEQWLLSAVLVESYRNTNGQPRQRTIKYLGSIRERWLDLSEGASTANRSHFWRDVDLSLSELHLSDIERIQITTAIEEKVPRQTPKDIQDNNERVAEAEHRLKMLKAQAGIR